ncbi:hypothetical protein FB45DRAFT_789011 [Roridomyces roridus]|uniref:Uncharacterized protein n=1 Tax=Roridomyces roridus TaxID=1738132 RepID=A0AAD7FTR9_9AGAR|nr:hypothetical protein FB45DRAFT_789011 [Roridomyces roridus]
MAAGVSLALFLVTAACVVVPWFYLSVQKAPGRPLTSTRSLLNIFLLLHSLFWLYSIMVLPPHNVYTRLKLPLSTPTDAIRSILLSQSDTGDLPRPLETLLKHLGSFEVKTYYVRFGHSVVANCDYCRSFDEFGMFALPGALLSYIFQAIVIGLVTISSSDRERWRTMGVAAVAGAFCAEAYYIVTAPIEIPKDDRDVFMWHDNLLFFRRLLFLLLPIIVHNAPASRHTAAIANPTLAAIRTAEQTTARLQLLRLTRGAVMRTPDLRARAAAWWTADAREGAWIREDEGVRDLARKLQSGFDGGAGSGSEEEAVGPLRQQARNTVTALKMGFAPSEFWRVPP